MTALFWLLERTGLPKVLIKPAAYAVVGLVIALGFNYARHEVREFYRAELTSEQTAHAVSVNNQQATDLARLQAQYLQGVRDDQALFPLLDAAVDGMCGPAGIAGPRVPSAAEPARVPGAADREFVEATRADLHACQAYVREHNYNVRQVRAVTVR